MLKIAKKLIVFSLLAAGLTLIVSHALASGPTLSKVRVSYRPDGGVSVTYFLISACDSGETETQCMDRIFTSNPLKDLLFDDIPLDQLPKDRSQRDKWRGAKSRGIWIDESLITKAEKLEDLQGELDEEIEKENPDLRKILRLQRKIEKLKETEVTHNILTPDQLAEFQEEQKKSFIAAAVQAVSELFGDVLNALKEGFLALKSLFVEKVQVGTADKPAGITVYDFTTRQPYCVIVRDGKVENIPGPCTFEARTLPESQSESVVETPPSPEATAGEAEPAAEPTPEATPSQPQAL